MNDFQAVLKRAETALNSALREMESPSSSLAVEFRELKLQACIFQYDVCAEMTSFVRNEPTGFAASVALKGMVLRLFEYDLLLNKHLIPRLLSLAKARNVPVGRDDIRALRKVWKQELSRLQGWADVWNQAAGHYSHNLQVQVRLLRTLDLTEVMGVTQAFLSFNIGILHVLKSAGQGNDA